MARKTAKVQKTNAMRELDAAGIAYELQSYEVEEDVPSGELGTHIAEMLGEDPDAAFKTLVFKWRACGVLHSCRSRA